MVDALLAHLPSPASSDTTFRAKAQSDKNWRFWSHRYVRRRRRLRLRRRRLRRWRNQSPPVPRNGQN